MSAREAILAAVAANRPVEEEGRGFHPRTPDWGQRPQTRITGGGTSDQGVVSSDAGLGALPPAGSHAWTEGGGAPGVAFANALAVMGGEAVWGDVDDPLGPVRERLRGVICSMVPEVAGTMQPDAEDMAAIAGVDVAVVRAVLGVAETGSVLFTEAELGVNAVAYLAQHLVVLLDPAEIVADVAAAYAHPVWRTARYAVLHTGPSATADIEGVLIRGAQGVRSLTVLMLQRGMVSAVTRN